MRLKKVGILTLSSAIALSGFGLYANAEEAVKAISKQEQAASDTSANNSTSSKAADSVEKSVLINRVNEIFPARFDFLTEADFNLGFSHHYPDEEEVQRVRLDFHKRLDNNTYINGNFEFAGENLELTSFYYQPKDREEAIFPPKVSREEAKQTATEFVSTLYSHGVYQLDETSSPNHYNRVNRPLTEPIEYRFVFKKLKNGIPIQDQSITVTVLGNGEITQLYTGRMVGESSFEEIDSIISKEEALAKWKQLIRAELKYLIKHNYPSKDNEVYLIYDDVPKIQSIYATNGKVNVQGTLYTDNETSEGFKLLEGTVKDPKPITKEEAEVIAKKLLKPTDRDNGKLVIEGVHEQELPSGEVIHVVQYMYRTSHGGYGSSISFKKETGELANFYNNMGYPYGEEVELENEISQEEALRIAVDYIKDYAYTALGDIAYPTISSTNPQGPKDKYVYRFYFPRVKNDMEVAGNGVTISIGKEDGSLHSLNINMTDISKWPSRANVVDPNIALNLFKEKIKLSLNYVSQNKYKYPPETAAKYKLEYVPTPTYYGSFFDAITGEWHTENNNMPVKEEKKKGNITHPWAEEELNYMIGANILNIDDYSTFNPDQAITKGEALELILKSLQPIYPEHERFKEEVSPFTNIPTDHPLYPVMRASVENGMLDPSKKKININETLTREELAYWYVRALGFEELAKHEEIFQSTFTDNSTIGTAYYGYVVIANKLGLITTNEALEINPKGKVTTAQLAVANIRLAKKLSKLNRSRY